MPMTILCVQWEAEDELPEMSKEEFDIIFAKSEVRPSPVGIRMYPYVWTIDEQGNDVKGFLG